MRTTDPCSRFETNMESLSNSMSLAPKPSGVFTFKSWSCSQTSASPFFVIFQINPRGESPTYRLPASSKAIPFGNPYSSGGDPNGGYGVNGVASGWDSGSKAAKSTACPSRSTLQMPWVPATFEALQTYRLP